MAKTVLIVAGGDAPANRFVETLPPFDLVICADGGLDHALRMSLAVDYCVGDLDSVTPDAVAAGEKAGVEFRRYPQKKDQTDLELALDLAVELGVSRAVVVGIGGGRRDHYLGNLLLLASPRFRAIELTAFDELACVSVVRVSRIFYGQPGETVSLFAVNGDAEGVTTKGLEYSLSSERLAASTSRGLSNTLISAEGSVSLTTGVVLVVQPDYLTNGGADELFR